MFPLTPTLSPKGEGVLKSPIPHKGERKFDWKRLSQEEKGNIRKEPPHPNLLPKREKEHK